MADEPEPNFEDALNRIERIVADLERGEPALSAALAKYEDGVKLLRHCYDLLDRAERSVALLTGVDEQGHPVTTPFDARATPSPEPEALPAAANLDPRPGRREPRSSPRSRSASGGVRRRPPTLLSDAKPGSIHLGRLPGPGKWRAGGTLKEIGHPDFSPQPLDSAVKSERAGPFRQNNPMQSAQLNFASQSFRGSHVDFRGGKAHNNFALLGRTGRKTCWGDRPAVDRGARRPAIGTRL